MEINQKKESHVIMNRKVWGALLVVFSLSGCVSSNVYQSTTALSPPINPSVLVLPADVEISLMNAGGNLEPRADWSEAARKGLYAALEEYFFEKGVLPVSYEGEVLADRDVDVIRQANVNLDAIELAQVRGTMPGLRSYALTPELLENMEKYEADYAAFVMLRASQASGGRVAVGLLAAVGGISLEMGNASYRVAIFDLRDGQVTWANFDAEALGVLGNPAEASSEAWQKSFESLFRDFPL
jgi:hypothetical protein